MGQGTVKRKTGRGEPTGLWHLADEGQVNEAVFRQVPEFEQKQSAIYERFARLEGYYDPNNASVVDQYTSDGRRVVNDNVIAANVDTVKAAIAETEVSPRVETDDGDWSQQRRAVHLEWYSEGLMKLHDVHPKARRGFVESAKKGTGLVKATANRSNQLCVEHVLPDDVIVNDLEARFDQPIRQMHHRRTNVSKEALKVEWPEFSDEIDRAGVLRGSAQVARRVQYSVQHQYECVVIESWYLPIGARKSKHYRPGRHTICIDGHDLLDEEYHKDFFPFAKIEWEHRSGSWYAIGGAERILGHQVTLDKLNWQIDRQHDQLAVPTTYIRPADAQMTVQSTSRLGTLAICRGDYPHTVLPQAVSGETYNFRERTLSGAFEVFGVSRMAAQAKKPAGIDSGVALREYRDQSTQRFATQEKAFEAFVLQIVWLMLDVCKDLGKSAPTVLAPTKFGRQQIEWSEVEMGDLKIQLAAASTMSRTPAGRLQTVLEWAQAGIVAQDEARRLLEHPDLKRSLSLYTAALDKIEADLERMADGEDVYPDPFTNLELAAWRAHMQYEQWSAGPENTRAPEDVLERVRTYASIAIYLQSQGAQANQPGAAVGAGGPAPVQPGQLPSAAPNAGAPASALNVQAANAVA